MALFKKRNSFVAFTNSRTRYVHIFSTVNELNSYLNSATNQSKTIGFVPTMGALHAGHGSLVSLAKTENELVVASIFVNPTQFNNPADLEKYPRSIAKDCQILDALGCDVVFIPAVSEIYTPEFQLPPIDLGFLDRVMEGKYRPGHFQGVVQVVYRLFQLVNPTKAYFGLKDFQQVAVIRFMTDFYQLPVQIVAAPTLREESGLAMSSRNLRLSEIQLREALHIFETLNFLKKIAFSISPNEAKDQAITFFNNGTLQLEYLAIVHPETLEELTTEWIPKAVVCIVAYCGDVRLIDNMQLD